MSGVLIYRLTYDNVEWTFEVVCSRGSLLITDVTDAIHLENGIECKQAALAEWIEDAGGIEVLQEAVRASRPLG